MLAPRSVGRRVRGWIAAPVWFFAAVLTVPGLVLAQLAAVIEG